MFAAIFQPNFVLLRMEFLFLFHLQLRMKISFVQRIIAFGLALFGLGFGAILSIKPLADHCVAYFFSTANGLHMLRFGLTHGLQRPLCGRIGDAVNLVGHAQFALCAGRAS